MGERVIVFMPRLGHTTGEMPHLRSPPKNWMPGQNLYYLYTACRNLGCTVKVVDGNWSRDPIQEVVDFQPDKVLLSTATPTFEDALRTIDALRERGYGNAIYVGGPHVSLNAGLRDWLLPAREGVVYLPLAGSASTFDWVPRVFPGRSAFEVLGMPEAEARAHVIDRWQRDTGKPPNRARLDAYLFSYFEPSMDWMDETYTGDHVRPEMQRIPIRHSIITSIGCSKTCSFCGNPYIYRIGFKPAAVVRTILRDFKRRGIDRLSVHDMFFAMHLPHTRAMMQVFREEGVRYSMQTCLENLTDALFAELAASGMRKFLVGIENPVSYSVGKKVELAKLRWLLDTVAQHDIEGVKLSYIVGLPGVTLEDDLALLDHIGGEVIARGHPLEDLQVNLYTPYRPEGDTRYTPYGEAPARGHGLRLLDRPEGGLHIRILTRIPFGYWGSFPVGIATEADLWRQMVLCDIVYDRVYGAFRQAYLDLRGRYVEALRSAYPGLAPHVPTFEASRRVFRRAARGRAAHAGTIGRRPGRRAAAPSCASLPGRPPVSRGGA